MFYSHEGTRCNEPADGLTAAHWPSYIVSMVADCLQVLTSRKYGVATIWLVATLGSKSTLKKVSRKAILDVDVQKACETIVTPEAPMALRLQSSLLYGVARVYSQQCGYVLNDAETAKTNMRTIFNVMRTSALEAEGGRKGRADQLILQDDPNFLPDFDLIPLDLEQLNLDLSATGEESQQSLFSPYNSQVSMGSERSMPQLDIPGRSSSWIGGAVTGSRGSFGMRGESGHVSAAGLMLEDDIGMDVLADGTIVFRDVPSRQPDAPRSRFERTDLESPGVNESRAYEAGLEVQDALARMDNDGFFPLQDDFGLDYGVEPFPQPRNAEQQAQQQTTSESAKAPARRRRKPEPKVIPVDTTLEVRNTDLARWNQEYIATMHDLARQKRAKHAAAIAKENAKFWVLGAGSLDLVGQANTLLKGPLDMFSGAKLLETLTGVNLLGTGDKRSRETTDGGEEGRRKRSRGLEPSSDEQGRALQDDDGYVPIGIDEYTGIEQGREAPTPLDDRHLSSIFPWNQSAGSRRPTGHFTSASISGMGIMPGSLSRRGSRMRSASPLISRGMFGGEAVVTNESQQGLGSVQAGSGDIDMEEFEKYGPAAQVDTQTAAQSQWQRAVLDSESINFLGFVQAAIADEEKIRENAGQENENLQAVQGFVEFATLLPAERNSRIVAAQGFLHILTLGTKHLLDVQQDRPFEAITMRCV
ncbi:hypothetical protein BAUCODRAFT_552473 [Baudoinia panamericana UAMH 10762]|uniref:Rad21/Rec8-like protein N-terminal domain-containing protein n=1 Tax=Baudoinia panamericana (strain UAMH 10762) TaxID=717646 RepID=M2N6B6_BAUPA|nr:uncharacterized protein BAUCODRAFT_552473 [Baudoinia panamericana UAMH 10762]EMC94579.1 hypothetical protein BAUCODRAFT_552473 [Baudoinia panamericana UAMH 10762]